MDKTFKQELEILPIKNIEHPVGNTKYYAAVHVKSLIAQADKEFQELSEKLDDTIDALDIARNSRDEFEREYKKLKSQLQQQALPVVPECVAEYIKTKLDKSKNLQDLYDEPLFHTGEAYLSGSEYNFISWFNENTTLFEKAWTNGYQVEKPQLFYLKNKLTGLYLACDAEGYLETGRTVAEKFTQQEIDSMQTGSYKQIEVEE